VAVPARPPVAPLLASAPPKTAAPLPGTPDPGTRNPGTPEPDPKSSLLAAIREGNKAFFGFVVAAAQTIDIDGDAIVFTFGPSHKGLRSQLEAKRGWIEQLAQSSIGRRMKVVAREGAPTPPADPATPARPGAQKTDLRARAQAEPSVQAVLDVFGGEIEDVEET
jgi:hypothetical protein